MSTRTARKLLKRARRAGIQFFLDGERLCGVCPENTEPGLLDDINANVDELTNIVRAEIQARPSPYGGWSPRQLLDEAEKAGVEVKVADEHGSLLLGGPVAVSPPWELIAELRRRQPEIAAFLNNPPPRVH